MSEHTEPNREVSMMRFERRLQICFPRTAVGWRRLFWLSLSRCPIHHKRLLPNEPWDSMKYGFCCDGVSFWHTGFLTMLRLNYTTNSRKPGQQDG